MSKVATLQKVKVQLAAVFHPFLRVDARGQQPYRQARQRTGKFADLYIIEFLCVDLDDIDQCQ